MCLKGKYLPAWGLPVPRKGEGAGRPGGAVKSPLSRMTQVSQPGPHLVCESPTSPAATEDPLSVPLPMSWRAWTVSAWAGGALTHPSIVSALDWRPVVSVSQQTGKARSLALGPRAEKQQAQYGQGHQGHTAKGRSPPGQPSPHTQPLHRQEGPERERRGGPEVPYVWGRQRCWKVLGNRATSLSLEGGTSGQSA